MIYEMFETNSSFSCEIAHYGKSLISAFQEIFAVLTKYLSWDEDQALGSNSMNFQHFLDIFKFSKILSLKLFDSSITLYPNSAGDSIIISIVTIVHFPS